MRTWFAVILTVLAALSGCISDGDAAPEQTQDDPSSTPEPTATPTNTADPSDEDEPQDTPAPGPGANTPPATTLSATIEQGTIPFDVVFTMDAVDDDNDTLAWTLDTDGDGVEETSGTELNLPGNFTYTYDAVGEYTVNFTVDDGTDITVRSITINATAAAAAPPGTQAVMHAGTVVAPDPFAATAGGCLFDVFERPDPATGSVFGADFPIEESQWGWDFSFDVSSLYAEFWDEEPNLYPGGASGKVPAGATSVVVCMDQPDAAVDFVLTLLP